MPRISRSQLVKCDKIVVGLGFDKCWSEYYHNSRNIKNGMAASEYIALHSVTSTEFNYRLADDIRAVKQLRIIKCDDSQSEPVRLEFKFRMPHFRGDITSALPPSSFWATGDASDELDNRTVLVVNHRLDDYDCTPDHKFKNVNMVLKNDIRGGHKLIIQVLDTKE